MSYEFTVDPHLSISISGSHDGQYDSSTDYNYHFYLNDFGNRVTIHLGGFNIQGNHIRESPYHHNFHSVAENNPNRFIKDAFWDENLAKVIRSWHRRDNIRKVAQFIRDHNHCPSSDEYEKMNLMEALK